MAESDTRVAHSRGVAWHYMDATPPARHCIRAKYRLRGIHLRGRPLPRGHRRRWLLATVRGCLLATARGCWMCAAALLLLTCTAAAVALGPPGAGRRGTSRASRGRSPPAGPVARAEGSPSGGARPPRRRARSTMPAQAASGAGEAEAEAEGAAGRSLLLALEDEAAGGDVGGGVDAPSAVDAMDAPSAVDAVDASSAVDAVGAPSAVDAPLSVDAPLAVDAPSAAGISLSAAGLVPTLRGGKPPATAVPTGAVSSSPRSPELSALQSKGASP